MIAIRYIAMMIVTLLMFGLVTVPGLATKLGLDGAGVMQMGGASKPKVALPPDPSEGEAGKQIKRADGSVWAIGPVAATPTGAPVFIDEVMTGYKPDRPDGSDFQFAVASLSDEAKQNCATPFYDGAVINHVYGYDSGIKSPLYSVTTKEFAGAMEVFVNTYRKSGRGHVNKNSGNSRQKVIHVAVPSQDRAVHLILSNNGKRLLWSLQLAPGAQLAGVTVLGGYGNSVAHVPADVPVHFLERGMMHKCGIVPSYPRVTSSSSVAIAEAIGVKNGQWLNPDEKDLPKKERFLRAYNNWFLARFDVPRDQGRSGYLMADMAVSAPVNPGELIAYRPLTGARIVIPDTGLTFGGALGEWPSAYQNKVVETLTQFAGGDIENLKLNVGN